MDWISFETVRAEQSTALRQPTLMECFLPFAQSLRGSLFKLTLCVVRECSGLEWRLWTSRAIVTPFFLFLCLSILREEILSSMKENLFKNSLIVDDASPHPHGSPFAGRGNLNRPLMKRATLSSS